jgi:hypothetical protein
MKNLANIYYMQQVEEKPKQNNKVITSSPLKDTSNSKIFHSSEASSKNPLSINNTNHSPGKNKQPTFNGIYLYLSIIHFKSLVNKIY